MRNQQTLKLFLALILSTGYILGFSHFGASAFNKLVNDQDIMEPGTTLGGLNISGKTKPEIKKLLEEEIVAWKQGTAINLTYKEIENQATDVDIQFQVEETLANVKSGQKNLVTVVIDQDTLVEAVYDTSISLSSEAVNTEQLANDISASATMLTAGSYRFHLENYLDGVTAEDEVIAKAVIKTGKYTSEIKEIISLIQPVEIQGRTQFSLLNKLKDLQEDKTYSTGALSRIATGIYETILPTNFAIIERSVSTKLPSYANLGMEAKVNAKKNTDLVFSNINEDSYFLEFTQSGKNLNVVLKGKSFLNHYNVKKSAEKRYQPKTIIQFDSQLTSGQMNVTEPGKEGISIKITREISDEKGNLIETEEISEDFYAPIHRIEIHPLSVPVVDSTDEESDNPADDVIDEDSDGVEDESGSDSEDGRTEETDESDNQGKTGDSTDSDSPTPNKEVDSERTEDSDDNIWEDPDAPEK
ncbi:VanW family protein [Peribacillus psychrosaccharolyticus]|uniref:VanW family protein n=1 Tax=Peribacillus psychrosaccharolyticus TaxID=1407 RepID=UPI003D2A6A5C